MSRDTFNTDSKLALDAFVLEQAKFVKTENDNIATRVLNETIEDAAKDDGNGGKVIQVSIVSEVFPPSNILLSDSTISTDAIVGDRVGILTVVDPNAADTHILEIITDDDDKFSIENPDTSSGLPAYLILKNTVDYQTKESHVVTVRATDPTGLSVTVVFTITVLANFSNTTSLLFNGSDEDANGGDIHNYDIGQAFSVSMWIKPNNLVAVRMLFSKATSDGSVNGYMLRANATTGQLYLQMRCSSSNRSHTFDTAVTAGDWQLIVFTYAGGSSIAGASIYRNAVKNTSVPSGGLGGTMLYGQAFILGQRNGSFGWYSGLMTQVAVWSKELTQSEVSELYATTKPTDLDQHSAAASLSSWYPIDDTIIPTIEDVTSGMDLTTSNMTTGNLIQDAP